MDRETFMTQQKSTAGEKDWQGILPFLSTMSEERLIELRKAMMVKILLSDSDVSLDEETAIALVKRYLSMCDEVGSPLMYEEAAYSMLDLMTVMYEEAGDSMQDLKKSNVVGSELLKVDLDTFKWRIVKAATDSFEYALEADPLVSDKMGLR